MASDSRLQLLLATVAALTLLLSGAVRLARSSPAAIHAPVAGPATPTVPDVPTGRERPGAESGPAAVERLDMAPRVSPAAATALASPPCTARSPHAGPLRVVIAGLPRSGSTWLYNAIFAMSQRALGVGDGSSARRFVKRRYRPTDDDPSKRLLVYKTHGFDEALARASDVVIVSHRDLRAICASAVAFAATGRKNWLGIRADGEPGACARTLQPYVESFSQWQPRAQLDVAYEAVFDAADVPSAQAALLRSFSAKAGLCAAATSDALAESVVEWVGGLAAQRKSAGARGSRFHRRHRTHADWRADLPGAEAQALWAANREYMVRYGYAESSGGSSFNDKAADESESARAATKPQDLPS